MSLGKVKGFLLIVCVLFSLFVALWRVPIVASPGDERNIQVYVVDAVDSPNWWVGSRAAVRDGVQAAINDAATRTKVKLAGEHIWNPIVISSSTELENLVNNPPEHAVVINTHGEPVPTPDRYLTPYVRIDRPLDGATLEGSFVVEAVVKPMGAPLNGPPHMLWGRPGNVEGRCVDMILVDPASGKYRQDLSFGESGTFEIDVRASNSYGFSSSAFVYVNYYVPPPPPTSGGLRAFKGYHIPLCPCLYAWNGTAFDVCNDVLFESDSPATDYCHLEKPLVADADGGCSVQLRESANKLDYFDRVGLLAVDHDPSVSVGVDPNGTILTCGSLCAPSSALYCGLTNAMWWLGAMDDFGCSPWTGHWLDLRFDGGLNESSSARLVLRTRNKSQGSISVQCFGGDGRWETVNVVKPRAFWSMSVVNLTGCLPDCAGDCKVRLLFKGNCTVDFVGLDTTPDTDAAVSEGRLVSVQDSSGVQATFGDLLDEDGVCAVLRHGYTFDLRFSLPQLNGTGLKRDFIFVAEGYCTEAEEQVGMGLAGLGGGGGGSGRTECLGVDWKDWFEKIENCCRTMGWVWANVAGYSAYYFGNNAYWNLMGQGYDQRKWLDTQQPRTGGLKQFLDKDVTCDTSCDGHVAELGPIDEDRLGFYRIYNLGRFGDVDGWRPLCSSDGLMRDTTLYVDKAPSRARVTAALLMNGTDLGMLVHSGLGPNEDDYTKGYIAAALAIEEARACLMNPYTPAPKVIGGNPHLATLSVSLVPGSEGLTYIENLGYHEYVDLLFTMNSYFEEIDGETGFPYYHSYRIYSDIEDLDLTRASGNVLFDIDEEAGIDTITGEQQLVQKIGWWGAGQTATLFLMAAGQILGAPLPFAGLVSLIPIYLSTITPPDSLTTRGDHNWINGIKVDTNDDYVCSSVIKCRVYFPSSSADYTFNCKMMSWISYYVDGSLPDYRVQNLNYTGTLQFTVKA